MTNEEREASDKSHAEVIREIIAESDERNKKVFIEAIRDVFSREGKSPDKGEAYAAVVRIPLICKDVLTMKDDISKINSNLNKGVWIILGAVILGLMGLLLK